MGFIKKLLMIAAISGLSVTAFADHVQFRKAGPFIFYSSQVARDPVTLKLIATDYEGQVKAVFENLKAQVTASGATMDDVVKLNVYMSDIDKVFPLVNKYMTSYFKNPKSLPTRTPIGCTFLKDSGFYISMDAIVYKP